MNWPPSPDPDKIEKDKKAAEFLKELGIPIMGTLVSHYDGDIRCIKAVDLYDILTDEEKLHKLISTLKLRAFW